MVILSINDFFVFISFVILLFVKVNYDFLDIFDNLKIELVIVFDGLCYEVYRQSVIFRLIRIRNFNVADFNRGKLFFEAYCDVEMESNKAFLLGDIFYYGFDMFIEFIENKIIFESKEN